MDDESGNSKFLDDFATATGAVDYRAVVLEKSWLVEGKHYGNAILTKFPLTEYETFSLPNPGFEVDNPDGSHWHLHDKVVQRAAIEIDGTSVRLFNLHYFPFHRFHRNLREPELQPIRNALIEKLRLADGAATILAGDFNNGNDDLITAYPELFTDDTLVDAVKFGPEEFDDFYTSDLFQLDHILYTKENFTLTAGQVARDPSDHRGIIADLQLKG